MNTGISTVPLARLLNPISRREPVDLERTYHLLGAHWYAKGLYTKAVVRGTQIKAKDVYRVEEGDFVYNRLFAWKGSFAVATQENHGCYVSNEFPSFAIDTEHVEPGYLSCFFRRASTWNESLGLSTGGTPTSRNRLKQDKLLGMRMPLPSIAEQRRLVTRVTELAAKIAAAQRLRQESTKEVDNLIRSVLDRTYHLTSTKYETVSLKQVCQTITDGDHWTPKFTDNGIRFIFVGNVSSGYLHFAGCKHVTPDYFATLSSTRRPQAGDVLYSAVGATLGVPAVVETSEPFCFQRHIAVIRPDAVRLRSKFLWHMLRSGVLFNQAWAKTTGSAQPTVPLGAIRELPVPVPPIPEQDKLINELDEMQRWVGRLQRLTRQSTVELDALLPAVLDRAFSGAL